MVSTVPDRRVQGSTETRLVHHLIHATLLAIPVMVAFWMGIVAIALSFTNAGYDAPLVMAAAVGVLAGVFWGGWLGFLLNTLDDPED
jgi:hypothetical protein